MIPPVGKSGAGNNFIKSSISIWGSSIKANVASITSPMLWGGIFVAIPTAMPPAPFTNKFGNLAGKTLGSISFPS